MFEKPVLDMIIQLGALGGLIVAVVMLIRQRAVNARQNGSAPTITENTNPGGNGENKPVTTIQCLRAQQGLKDSVDQTMEKYGDIQSKRLDKFEGKLDDALKELRGVMK